MRMNWKGVANFQLAEHLHVFLSFAVNVDERHDQI